MLILSPYPPRQSDKRIVCSFSGMPLASFSPGYYAPKGTMSTGVPAGCACPASWPGRRFVAGLRDVCLPTVSINSKKQAT